jgi:CO/xanthine dehydrogenase Mo-binding subunit
MTPRLTTRREFLARTGVAAGGGIIVLLVAGTSGWETLDAIETIEGQQQGATMVSAWLHIDERGAITVYTGKVEIGQGIRTSLAQAVAEELRVPFASVTMVMGDTDLTPFDQGTFGSRTTPTMNPQLRRASATAREILIGLAADQWHVDRATLAAADGKITGGGRSISYGELTKGRQLTEVVRADVALTPADKWTVMGTSAPKVTAREIVTGTHQYTSDIQRPGMLHAKVVRARATGASLSAVDITAASARPDVVVVHDGSFVGVAAPSVVMAELAAGAVRATWTPPTPAVTSSHQLFDYFKPATPAASSVSLGPMPKLSRRYTVAYIAHVPLEPRAAVAEWSRDAQGAEKLTVWTGTQRPWGVRDELAAAFGIPATQVRVIMPDMGSGYGGKHSGECAVEAARIARAAKKPVRLVWTREEEFRWAYFRPAGVIEIAATTGGDGKIATWTFDNYNSGNAALRSPYAGTEQANYHQATSPFKQGSYRGLAATANNWARETHVDELAELTKTDPVTFRMNNLSDERLRAVLRATADRISWGSPVPDGHGVGIACGTEKGSYIATAAEVAVDKSTGAVRLVRIVATFECGAIVNPDGLKNQVVGSLIQGIGGALFEAIDFENGVIQNAQLSQYRVPRFSDIPPIDVVLLDRKDLPSAGAGETAIIAIAPAIGSAIWRVTGKRPRSLPMARNGVEV